MQIGVEACISLKLCGIAYRLIFLNGSKVEGHLLGHRDLDNLGHREKSYGIQIFSVSLTVSVFKPQVQY